MATSEIVLRTEDLALWYDEKQALKEVTIGVPRNRVTALIGPSGCGKSTLLRCFNRMNDLIPGCRVEGGLYFNETPLSDIPDVVQLRKHIGMVFQRPNPFPKSIYENVAYGPRVHGERNSAALD